MSIKTRQEIETVLALIDLSNYQPKSTIKLSLKISPDESECMYCRKTESVLWRRIIINDIIYWVCNACGLRYTKGNHCNECHDIYYESEIGLINWIKCPVCLYITHKTCIYNYRTLKKQCCQINLLNKLFTS